MLCVISVDLGYRVTSWLTWVCPCNPSYPSVNELWGAAGLMTAQDFEVIVVTQIVLRSLSVMCVVARLEAQPPICVCENAGCILITLKCIK